jgi:putative phage-type endonuclease
MSKKIISAAESNLEYANRDLSDWLRNRRTGITGTDVGKIMGVSKWGSPQDVWKDKVGISQPIEDNESMLWGRILEDVIAMEYSRRNAVRYYKPETLRGKEDWMIGSPDGIIVNDSNEDEYGLEVKTSRSLKTFSNGIPADYEYQCRWYMMICDLPYWDLAALIMGSQYQQFRVMRDNDIEEQMIKTCGDFWFNHVKALVPVVSI